MFVVLLTLLIPSRSFAFFDFLGEQGKQAIEVAGYVDALAELSSEVSPDEDVKAGAKDVRTRADNLRSDVSSARYVSNSSKTILSGPDWTSRRLETNIRSTTEYVRRFKSLFSRIAVLGTNGAIALNTTETNVALNEVQKNQQAIMIQNEDAKLREIEKENEEAKQWSEFSSQQRKARGPKD